MTIKIQKRKETTYTRDGKMYHCPKCFNYTAHDKHHNPPFDVYICRICGNRIEFKHKDK